MGRLDSVSNWPVSDIALMLNEFEKIVGNDITDNNNWGTHNPSVTGSPRKTGSHLTPAQIAASVNVFLEYTGALNGAYDLDKIPPFIREVLPTLLEPTHWT